MKTILIQTGVTVLIALIAWCLSRPPLSIDVDKLIPTGILFAIISLLIEILVRLMRLVRDSDRRNQIDEKSYCSVIMKIQQLHPVFKERAQELTQNIKDIADGVIHVNKRSHVYLLDQKFIGLMKKKDVLKATVPLFATKLKEQFDDMYFKRSIDAQIAAAKRKVSVKRLYLIDNKSLLTNPALVKHLNHLERNMIEVRYLLGDEDHNGKAMNTDWMFFGDKVFSEGETSEEMLDELAASFQLVSNAGNNGIKNKSANWDSWWETKAHAYTPLPVP